MMIDIITQLAPELVKAIILPCSETRANVTKVGLERNRPQYAVYIAIVKHRPSRKLSGILTGSLHIKSAKTRQSTKPELSMAKTVVNVLHFL